MENKSINILLIHADQHRYDCIGAYGNEEIKTPNIDQLAADGVLYTNSFCTFPVCTPSRYSLLSSLYVHQHSGWNNHCTLHEGIDTFPKNLKNMGFYTKAVGKMHFTPTYLDVGFTEMELAEQDGPGRYDDDYHRYLKANNLNDTIDLMDQLKEYRQDAPSEYWESFGAMTSKNKEKHHSTTWIGNRALDSINKWGSDNNLLMVGFIKPHHPFDPPAEWDDLYDPEEISLLPGWINKCSDMDIKKNSGYFPHANLDVKSIKKVMANYYASISQIDHHVGRMIELLKNKGLYDNTMIIYTSDHGDYMGYHHMLLKGNYMYDPLMQVPLIIKYPFQKHAGTISEKLISNIDVGPTILNQVNSENEGFGEGLNIDDEKNKREFIFAESRHGEDYMVRTLDFKLLLCKDDSMSQFFDLTDDRFEMRNLYDMPEYADTIQKYKTILKDWLLFKCPSPVYLNERARTIDSNNALKFDSGHRKASYEYFHKKMLKELKS